MPSIVATVRDTIVTRAFENVIELDAVNVRELFPQPSAPAARAATVRASFVSAYKHALASMIAQQRVEILRASIARALDLDADDAPTVDAFFTERALEQFAEAIFVAIMHAPKPQPPAAASLHVDGHDAYTLDLQNDEFIHVVARLFVPNGASSRTRNIALRMRQHTLESSDAAAPVARADAAGVAPTNAKDTLHRLTQLFFSTIVANGDNKPTVTSLLFHLYFTALYNTKLLVQRDIGTQTPIVPRDSVATVPDQFHSVRAHIQQLLDTDPHFAEPLLAQLLYVTHQSFCIAWYPVPKYAHANMHLCDLSAREYIIPAAWTDLVASWATAQAHGLDAIFQHALFGPPLPFHVRADATGNDNGTNDDPLHWRPLQTPTGVSRNADNVPVVDPDTAASYKKQQFLGATWGNVRGFAVHPREGDVLALHDRIATAWEDASKSTDLKREAESLLAVYAQLTERDMAVAELFAGSGAKQLPPPGFMITVALGLSIKYRQSVWSDLDLLFALGAAVFDASIAAWYYKATAMQARPVTAIRHFYKDAVVHSWAPGRGIVDMPGAQWMPFQTLDFVTPPFPDVMSGHSTFSAAAGDVLKWWFNSDMLYDGFTIVPIADCSLIANNLSMAIKSMAIGEYIVEPGSSDVEPGIVPARTQILRYNTITDLILDAGRSRIYGGIHWEQTNQLSLTLGYDIALRIQRAVNDRGIVSPFRTAA